MTCPYRREVKGVRVCQEALDAEVGHVDPADYQCEVDCRRIEELERERDQLRVRAEKAERQVVVLMLQPPKPATLTKRQRWERKRKP